MLIGKLTEQAKEDNKEMGREEDDNIFVDSSPTMGMDEHTVTTQIDQESGGDKSLTTTQ
jgi:hypothetical protein